MSSYVIKLWTAGKDGRVPKTSVEAETNLEACVHGLDEFRLLKEPFDLDSRVVAKLAANDDDDDDGAEPITVSDVVAWAKGRGRRFVTDQKLDWLLTF
jgi:hypothetical protein